MNQKRFYITTTIPYVNAAPHIGFALEIVQADVLARYHNLLGEEVFFNFGSDEHGVKIYRRALEEGKDPHAYVDEYAAKFSALKEALNLSYTAFVRTTSPHHKLAAQEFWKKCLASDDIYLKDYEVKYCIGCELEKTDSELKNGKCPIHPNLEIEIIKEKNYFFRWKKYEQRLLEMYASQPDFVVPSFRFNEIKKFVASGLEDFSISRLKEKMPWGVEVPGNPDHVMYVWFDALVNYISTLGWPEDDKKFHKFWGTHDEPNGLQLAGKDQVRQQAAMWQAMLMSANLPQTRQIIIHGFITSGGQKMSKSLGNVIDPMVLVKEYGTDALRYFLARHIHPFEDSDFTVERFKEVYNGELANGLGNLVSRVMKLSEEYSVTTLIPKFSFSPQMRRAMENFEFNDAMGFVWQRVQAADRYMTDNEPYKVIKSDAVNGKVHIQFLVQYVFEIAKMLEPFMPDTSEKILEAIRENKKPVNLFPRKD